MPSCIASRHENDPITRPACSPTFGKACSITPCHHTVPFPAIRMAVANALQTETTTGQTPTPSPTLLRDGHGEHLGRPDKRRPEDAPSGGHNGRGYGHPR